MHDNPGWENFALEVWKELHGEEELKSRLAEADKPPPEPGLFSSLQLAHYVKKYQVAFTLKVGITKERGTHPRGIAADGIATVVSNPLFPDHELFIPGHSFAVRLRHANLVRHDDAFVDVRAVSLKFSDNGFESPLDLFFHTGEEAAFWNIASFDEMMIALVGGSEAFKEYVFKYPQSYYLACQVFRRAPDSFTDQRYYSWMAYDFKAKDGVRRYAKFRLLPADGRPETGLLNESDQRKIWEFGRLPEEKRSEQYLKKEFRDRLVKGPIKYKLQIQLHACSPDDSHLVLHSARPWDRETHPWLDLAEVQVTTPISYEAMERSACSLDNHHPDLCLLPEPKTIYDLTSVEYLRRKIYPISRSIRGVKPMNGISENKTIYRVIVETGQRLNAGTDATVSMVITGTKGKTDEFVLDKLFHNDFESGQKDEYTIEAVDVGEVLTIKLMKDGGGWLKRDSDWFVNRVYVMKPNPPVVCEFPFYRWVQKEADLFIGKAFLPNAEQNRIILDQRHLEIQQRQELYHWGDNPAYSVDLPGFIKAGEPKSLPKDVQFTTEAIDTLHSARSDALINLGLGKLSTLLSSWESFDDFRSMLSSYVGGIPPAADEWHTDVWFGKQFLNACNPDTIKRCKQLPPHFPVTNDILGNLLDHGVTLVQALKDERIYMVDYRILEDIPHFDQNGKRRYTSASMGLFYVRNNGDLVPIAIQLHQEPSDTNPIWTPNDTKYDWIYAKLWLRNADTQWHQMITHLLRTHLFMEPIAVATWRQLPSLHPVWKLLFPHIRGVLAINTLGRDRLIAKGGISDQTLSIGGGGHIKLMQKYYRNMTWESYDLPKVLKERGVDDPDKLPRFYYRDDALILWSAISEFVKEITSIYYASDDDVTKDHEIQSWIKDIHDNGYPSGSDGVDKGIPPSFTSRGGLVHFLTVYIFTCSCQHAAVNFSQMDAYGFPPNSPSILRKPPPTEKGKTTLQCIMESLPSKHRAGVVIATVFDLTRLYPTEKYLGDFSEGLFTDDKAIKAIIRFQGNLQEISATIQERNKKLDVPYPYLLPEKVPNSIAI